MRGARHLLKFSAISLPPFGSSRLKVLLSRSLALTLLVDVVCLVGCSRSRFVRMYVLILALIIMYTHYHVYLLL